MCNTLFLASLLCFTINLNPQNKYFAKEKLNYGKEKVKELRQIKRGNK